MLYMQARLHQKLMDVQYQLRMSGEGVMIRNGAVGHGRSSRPISSKHSMTPTLSDMGSAPAVSPPGTGDYWKTTSPQVQNEILKHEVQQSKVIIQNSTLFIYCGRITVKTQIVHLISGVNLFQIQQQIERLRISQIEKQLELKEASTRRKILALKQQLQGGSKPPATAPEKRSMNTPATGKAIPMSKSDQTVLSSNVQKIKTETTTSLNNSPLQAPPTLQNMVSTSGQGTNQSRAAHTLHRSDSQRTKVLAPGPTEISKASPSPVICRLTPDTSMTDPHIQSKQKTKLYEKAANQELSPPPVTTPSTLTKTEIPHLISRQKLTLPEEIKETEYMSALQRQRARVSRIRRCIVAATVIQRTWRDYTDKKK